MADRARRARAEADAKAKAAAGADKAEAKAADKAAVTSELMRRKEVATRAELAASLRPVERPATPEELAELKRQYGLERRAHR